MRTCVCALSVSLFISVVAAAPPELAQCTDSPHADARWPAKQGAGHGADRLTPPWTTPNPLSVTVTLRNVTSNGIPEARGVPWKVCPSPCWRVFAGLALCIFSLIEGDELLVA